MGIPPRPYFISLAAREIALRIIVISSVFSVLINVIFGEQVAQDDVLAGSILMGLSIVPILVSLHHILRLWPRQKWSVRADFIYSTAELGFVTGYLIAEIMLIAKTDAFSIMICIFALAFLWLSIGASFVFTILNLRASKYRTFKSTYNFADNHGKIKTGWGNSKPGQWSLLLGENTFKKRFGIDRTFVRGLRAVIAIVCLLGMITLGYLVLIVQPIQRQLHFQTMRTADHSKYTDGNVTMQVSLAVGTWNSEPMLPSKLFGLDVAWGHESLHILCDNAGEAGSITCNVPSPFSRSSPDNLMITVNYTRALQQFPWQSLRTGVYLNFNTDAPRSDAFATQSTQLYPGFHLFGTTFYSFRDTYASSRDLAFGIPHFDRRLVANVQALIPDPDFTNSTPSVDSATLKMTYQGGLPAVQLEYQVQKEQSSNSVLSGFATLGGAWTFISGLFATVFGCQLLLVLFGIKPLSIYGLVHFFGGRRSLVDGGYTLSVEEQSRTLAVLREHLLDNNADLDVDEASEDEERSKIHDTV